MRVDLRQTGVQRTAVHRAFDASNAPAPDPSVPVADEERRGMSSTEPTPSRRSA